MPQATDIVINNAAAVAKTFTLGSPASDTNVSWWELKEGLIKQAFARITALARPTGDKARKVNFKFSYPSSYTNTTTGLMSIGSTAFAEISVKMPDDFPEAMKNDFAAYVKNMAAHALVNAMLRDASSAT